MPMSLSLQVNMLATVLSFGFLAAIVFGVL